MKSRIENIDGLRGFAAFAVILGHWGEYIASHGSSEKIRETASFFWLQDFSFGRFGVVAFFCVSGFVIPFSFRGDSLSFLISRFFRLYPAYWLSLAIGAVLLPAFGEHFSVSQIIANITMFQSFLHQKDVIGTYWTLSIELVFYGICLMMFIFGKLHDARDHFFCVMLFSIISILIGCYRFHKTHSDIPLGFPTYLAAMHFGTLARLAVLENNGIAKRLYFPAFLVLIISILFANTAGYVHAIDKKVGWIAANTGYLAGLAAFLACIHLRLFKGHVFPLLGKISYSAYLLHPIFITAAEYYWGRHNLSWVGAFGVFAIMIAGIVVSSACVQHLVEKPSTDLGKRLDRWRIAKGWRSNLASL